MKRQISWALLAGGIALAVSAASAVPAAAAWRNRLRSNVLMGGPLRLQAAGIISDGARFGKSKAQEVQRQSEGKYRLGPGTLYDNLQKLMDRGLVDEVGRRPEDDDPRRRYYKLSSLGRGVLTAEITRLEDVVREGKMRLQAKPRRA